MRISVVILHFLLALFMSLSGAYAQHPESRWISLSAYDSANQQFILYGGANDKGVLTDLWAYKNSKWRKLDSSGPDIIKCSFAYDINRRKAVLYGGTGPKTIMDETWEWDGSHWAKKDIAGPGARNHPMSVYDPKEKIIILFGGYGESGWLNDTWSYNGKSWTLLDKDGPKNCLPHGLYYDEAGSKVMMVTLSAEHDKTDPNRIPDRLWEWTGKSWKNVPGGSITTSGQGLQGLARFGKSDILLFDGDDVSNGHGKTWLYSQGHWQTLPVKGPGPRVGHTMLYNPLTNKTILFGGSDRRNFFNDLWEWDGKTWKEVKAP